MGDNTLLCDASIDVTVHWKVYELTCVSEWPSITCSFDPPPSGSSGPSAGRNLKVAPLINLVPTGPPNPSIPPRPYNPLPVVHINKGLWSVMARVIQVKRWIIESVTFNEPTSCKRSVDVRGWLVDKHGRHSIIIANITAPILSNLVKRYFPNSGWGMALFYLAVKWECLDQQVEVDSREHMWKARLRTCSRGKLKVSG